MNSINKYFGKTTVVGEEQERIYRAFTNDEKMIHEWITIDYDREETASHLNMIVTSVEVRHDEIMFFTGLEAEEIREQAIEWAKLYLENKGRVEFNL